MQTEKPYWLKEAYSSAIVSSDTGLVKRNLYFADFTTECLSENFDVTRKFLDYGGGYGLFVRLMRDRGFNFYRQDPHCINLFAPFFDITDLSVVERNFELITAFEVFEHLEDPHIAVEQLLRYTDTILFSTELQPSSQPAILQLWSYLAPHGGQHISLFSYESLKVLADKHQLTYYSDGRGLHIFTKKHLVNNPFHTKSFIARFLRKGRKIFHLTDPIPKLSSLTQSDCDIVITRTNNQS